MGPIIGGGFIVILGMYFLINSMKNFKNFEASKSWPSCSGVVNKSEVWRPRSTSSHRVWTIEYKYKVDGTEYTGYRAALYTPLYEEIMRWQEGRQKGDTTQVFYNPAKPDEAVLITGGRDSKKFGEIILSVLAVILGFAVMVAGYLGYLS